MRALIPILALSLTLQAADLPKPKAEHVLLCVWDGMRPDFITPENTPNLHALAQRGTFFANNHSMWISTTEVNGTVLATGAFPEHSTIIANREYRPRINPKGAVATEDKETIEKGDELTGGHYIAVPTVAELVRAAGFSTIIAGTKPVALLHDRALTRPEKPRSVTLFAGHTHPESALAPLTMALGEFPAWKPDFADPKPNEGQNTWTTSALVEHLWRDEIPRYTVLWLSDPDFVQHISRPGHPGALASIHGSDVNLGRALAALEKHGVLDKTDVFVVSDHGFSSIERVADPAAYFNEHGVHVVRSFNKPSQPGDVFTVGIGASQLLYVHDHDKVVEAKLVELLQQSDFAGAIFSRSALPGTFPLSESRLNSPESPDVIFSFRWRDGKNEFGAPGLIVAEGKLGLGTHGTLGRSDIHNTLVGAGPDIRAGYRDEFPTGNIDVAPTILHLLGLDEHAAKCDGRIVAEALAGTEPPTEKPVTQRREATDSKTWKQYLQTTTFAGKLYFDEGNVVLP
jgi:arylsulfatase A-like enzyme